MEVDEAAAALEDATVAAALEEAADATSVFEEATTPLEAWPALLVSVAMLVVSFFCSAARSLSRSDVSEPLALA